MGGLAQAFAHAPSGADADAHYTYAARLFGAADALRRAIETPLPPFARPAYRRAVDIVRERLGPDPCAAEWTAGATMPLDDAIADALNPPRA